ncbi:MAG: hypothetical protein ACK4NF_04610, partial [Planctomycetota bacterium]
KETTKQQSSSLKGIEDTSECKYYVFKEIYKCNTCLKFLSEDQKIQHSQQHQVEKVKVGERLQCQTCKRLFAGEITGYCPKCKGRLKLELIEIDEHDDDGKKYFLNKKTGERVCPIEEKNNDNILPQPPLTPQTTDKKSDN